MGYRIEKNKLVSVICTVKNGEKTLEETILSVINQSYKNWELIIVDDGSDDSTIKIIEKFAERDKRIIPIYTNGIGRGKALNLAIKNSNGDYIANIDADDLMHPNRLEFQLQHLMKNDDIFLICSNAVIFYNDRKIIWEKQRNTMPQIISDSLLIKNSINHSSVMFNKKALIEIGGYNEKLKSQFDYELWLRALANEKLIMKIPINLVAKRIHNQQSFENKNRLIYLFRSQKLQIKYSIRMKRKVFAVLIITPFRIVLGLLPFSIRRKINIIINKAF